MGANWLDAQLNYAKKVVETEWPEWMFNCSRSAELKEKEIDTNAKYNYQRSYDPV